MGIGLANFLSTCELTVLFSTASEIKCFSSTGSTVWGLFSPRSGILNVVSAELKVFKMVCSCSIVVRSYALDPVCPVFFTQ